MVIKYRNVTVSIEHGSTLVTLEYPEGIKNPSYRYPFDITKIHWHDERLKDYDYAEKWFICSTAIDCKAKTVSGQQLTLEAITNEA